ncbi:MAG TPA: Hsp20/alpha crystallin family protein [Kiritimatiellia bacterium]|nr:Hsp20/alpha crystallin family protein [Kiritimatiellia bacterium]
MVWPVTAWWDADPFVEMQRLHREVNRLFSQASVDTEYPAVNVWSNDHEVVLTAEIPGVDPSKVELTVHEDHVTLKGVREGETLNEDVTCHRAERLTGSFVRSFRLPFDISSDQVTATSRNGILTVRLPRAEASKPKQINVTAG